MNGIDRRSDRGLGATDADHAADENGRTKLGTTKLGISLRIRRAGHRCERGSQQGAGSDPETGRAMTVASCSGRAPGVAMVTHDANLQLVE
jgi:hypothetical protein